MAASVAVEAAASAAAVDLAAVVADSPKPTGDTLDLLGVSLNTMSRAEIENEICNHLAGSDPGLLHVVTLNPEYVVSAQSSPEFREALGRADLVVPDGIGIVLAVRVLNRLNIARITGVDLVTWLFEGELPVFPRVFLLGAPASVAALQGRYPRRVAGRWGSGTADAGDDVASIMRIRERNANVVLVGYGAPGQILWIDRNRDALAEAGVRLVIGVGGALDFASGTVARAPEPIRRLGLEWAFRLLREPWRWRRQLALPKFALLVVRAYRECGRAA